MTDDERKAAAKAIDDAVKAATDKAKADAEGEVSLKDVMAAIGKCSEAIDGHGKALGEMGDRLTALEAGGAVDDDGDPSGEKARQAAVDAAKRADADTPEMRQQRAEAQYACDQVAVLWNERAPAPLVNEDLISYRCRLLEPYKRHSVYRDMDLHKLAAADPTVLDVAAKQIYADASAASRAPERVPYGQLLMHEKRMDNGSLYRTFQGRPNGWMDEIAGPVRNYVKSGLGPEVRDNF
jgi:hypothetical protein